MIELARRRNVGLCESEMTRHDLYTAQECFLTGTGAEVIPVTKIDGRPIGDGQPGRLTRQLMTDFHALVQRGE